MKRDALALGLGLLSSTLMGCSTATTRLGLLSQQDLAARARASLVSVEQLGAFSGEGCHSGYSFYQVGNSSYDNDSLEYAISNIHYKNYVAKSISRKDVVALTDVTITHSFWVVPLILLNFYSGCTRVWGVPVVVDKGS